MQKELIPHVPLAAVLNSSVAALENTLSWENNTRRVNFWRYSFKYLIVYLYLYKDETLFERRDIR